MQDQILSGFPQLNVQFPEQEQLRCPRCDSNNTKFCYYNNYNLSQPRHFCKSCKRYWTKGGTLRNIPVGGGCRKSAKRPRVAQNSSPPPLPPPTAATAAVQSTGSGSETVTQGHQPQNPSLKVEAGSVQTLATGPASGESFTSLLGMASKGQFGNFVDGFGHDGLKFGSDQDSGSELVQGSISEANCWVNYNNNNGWPDLVINTTNPGSKLQ